MDRPARETRIKLAEGKYEIVLNENPDSYEFKALRHGEEWRDLIGDNLILALVFKIEALEEQAREARANEHP
jgi:hypothetical protein